MADQVNGVGSFIPNKAGNPKILTLSPAERAEYLAAKSAKEQKARTEEAVAIGPVESDAAGAATVEPVTAPPPPPASKTTILIAVGAVGVVVLLIVAVVAAKVCGGGKGTGQKYDVVPPTPSGSGPKDDSLAAVEMDSRV